MANSKTTVGRSHRTPLKHWMLDTELGRVVGALATKKTHAKPCPFHIIDLCAGDGYRSKESPRSSPEIIIHHAKWSLRNLMDTRVTLIEKSSGTFESLVLNTPSMPWIEKLNIDSREYVFQKTDEHQAVFINADPNTIANWPITTRLLESLPETTTMLATLGCNTGGVKRLPEESRRLWFDYVADSVVAMPEYHDALLIQLQGDRTQWAYLLRLPEAWSERTVLQYMHASPKYTNFSLNIASYRSDHKKFLEIEQYLFDTHKERGARK